MDSSGLTDRLRAALDLADAGFDLMRQNLRRANPEASDEEIEELFVTWLRHRPLKAPGQPRRPTAA